MTNDIKLKPCPFCGGEAYYNYQKENECICCEECGAKLTYLDFGDAHDKLVKQWNTRPIEDKLKEALRFYAEKKEYEAWIGFGNNQERRGRIWKDNGKIARKTLKEIGE